MDWSAKIVEQNGSGSFAQVGSTLSGLPATSPITTVRNGKGGLTLQLPRDHAWVGHLCGSKWMFRELQVYRGSEPNPFWWGIPTQPSKQLGSEKVTIGLEEVIPGLLERRHVGRAQRLNYVTDGDFESGALAPNWTTAGVDSATVIGDDFVSGGRSVQLIESSGGADSYVEQTFNFSSTPLGDIVITAGHFRIVSFSGPAFENRGLFMEYRIGGALQYHTFEPIDQRDGLKRNWQRKKIGFGKAPQIPASTTVQIKIRGYAPKGTIRWDRFWVGVMESTGAHPINGDDIGTLAALLVQHAQSVGYDKDDMDIDASMPTTGTIVFDVWQHAEHANIWRDCLAALVNREEGLDFGYAYTPTSRTLVGYDRTHGRAGKGTNRTALNLNIPNDYVADYGWDLNGREAASWNVEMGDGDGPDREDGAYRDTTLFGGRSLERIGRAPTGTRVADLDGRASKMGEAHRRPGLFQLQLKPGVIWATGDKVGLPAYDGAIVPGVYRVADTSHNPFTDSMIVSVEQMP